MFFPLEEEVAVLTFFMFWHEKNYSVSNDKKEGKNEIRKNKNGF